MDLLTRVQDLPAALLPLREEILANLVMLAQTPAPTGREDRRVRFVLDRFTEAGLPEAGTDEAGNAVGFLPGHVGSRSIMLAAHLDTIFPESTDHDVIVQADRIIGPGVSDNALGASIVSMLPSLLQDLGIELESNLQLLGTVRSLGRGNHAGLRFHLDHALHETDFGIVLEGIHLGRLDFFSVGAIRADVVCDVNSERDARFGSESALIALNQIINRILGIPVPTRPFTRIRLGKLRAGVSHDTVPDHAELGLEVLSESDEMIQRIHDDIESIVAEASAGGSVEASFDCFFQRDAGRIPFGHPLVKTVNEVMSALEITPNQEHRPSELSEFIARHIPAVTLGISHGESNLRRQDHVMIEPILTGIAQILGCVLAIDEGACDER
jgi:acetylornithine deacetylase/succinyl-diaminopimelate desuccinylase-like protein